eukprot:1701222-Lingulodinium_polyedra.AAC.1
MHEQVLFWLAATVRKLDKLLVHFTAHNKPRVLHLAELISDLPTRTRWNVLVPEFYPGMEPPP